MSWEPYNTDDDDSGDEEFSSGPNLFKGREAIIFLIDGYLYENENNFLQTLELIRNALLSGLMTRDKDLISVVLANTKNSQKPKDNVGLQNIVMAENTAIILPLKELTKDSVEYFKNFTTQDYFDFGNQYGVAEGNYSNTLRMCGNIFQQCGFKLSNMSIVYFTDREAPHSLDSSLLQKAMVKAKDLDDTDTGFNVIPMVDNFDYTKFYKEFICLSRGIPLEDFVTPDIEEERKLISNRQLRQDFVRRCLVHIPFHLGTDLSMSVCLYNYFKKQVYPKKVKLLATDNSIIEVKRVRKSGTVDEETKEVRNERYMKPGDERKVLMVGGQKICFKSEEVAKLRSPLSPGFKLLGFLDRKDISIQRYICPSFLYPDENCTAGSTKLFRALWEKCIEKHKTAIGVLVTRRKSTPKFVALFPSQINTNVALGASQADGFRVMYLPSQDTIRSLNLHDWNSVEPPSSGNEMFKKIVKKLRSKYSITMFKDPSLEILQRIIMETTFNIETEGCEDIGMPDIDLQDQRIGEYVNDLADIFGNDVTIGTKRKATEDGVGNGFPKIKKISDDQINRETIDQLISNNAIGTLSVKQLKLYLQQNAVKVTSTATKSVLIEKVFELHT